jgi:hypothetical protein
MEYEILRILLALVLWSYQTFHILNHQTRLEIYSAFMQVALEEIWWSLGAKLDQGLRQDEERATKPEGSQDERLLMPR